MHGFKESVMYHVKLGRDESRGGAQDQRNVSSMIQQLANVDTEPGLSVPSWDQLLSLQLCIQRKHGTTKRVEIAKPWCYVASR